MTNDTTVGNNPEGATACAALSKNDGCLISAPGGKVSVFNMMTFKVCLLQLSITISSQFHD
jgi:hypothetical protein